jgi:rod shape-determining protein MreC
MAKKTLGYSKNRFYYLKYFLCGLVIIGSIWGPYKIDMPYLRSRLIDFFHPFVETLGFPLRWIEKEISLIYEYANLHEQLQRLRMENKLLKMNNYWMKEVLEQNKNLKKINRFVELPESISYTVRVIGVPNDSNNQTLLVAAGRKHGIDKNFAVLNEEGVIGRIIEVGEETARVLLLTDQRFRIPVLVQSTREQAIITGNGTEYPLLLYIRDSKQLKVGETLVTSGYGGVFPPGLFVGKVFSIEEEGIKIQPLLLTSLEYVKIVKFFNSAVFAE